MHLSPSFQALAPFLKPLPLPQASLSFQIAVILVVSSLTKKLVAEDFYSRYADPSTV